MLNKSGAKLVLLTALSLLTISSFGAPKSKSEFCKSQGSSDFVQSSLLERTSRMAFQNYGGLINGGVCWWHSRFQRNAIYLTVYRPDLPKPTTIEAEEIIKDIRFAKGVVTIPGYENFNEFSRDYHDEIQSRLEGWQRTDGMIFQQWVVGLAGSSETTEEKLKKEMDELYKQVKAGDIVYQKLQIKGITAHAWLVIGMTKNEYGYDLFVIDSNSPSSTQTYRYKEGNQSFYHSYYGNFVPYTGKNRELKKLKRRVKSFCR